MKLTEIILNQMKNVSKPQKKFFEILMHTILSMYGKVNFSSLSRQSNISEKTFRRWFKKTFNFGQFNSNAIDTVVTKGSDLVAAFDQSFNDKAGKMTWGRDNFWNGCASKAEKGLELTLCAIVDVGKNMAYALKADQTPTAAEIKRELASSDGLGDETRVDFYLSCIGKIKTLILKYTKYFVFDGYFTKQKFVDGITDMGFHFIGKLRSDAHLKKLYIGERKKGRGRPKQFDGKCDVEDLDNFAFELEVDPKIKLYSGIFYQPSLRRIIKVVVVVYAVGDKIGTALLFSTDLSLSALKIFQYYKARFQIEFLFRDAKQHTGLSDCQSRQKEAILFHFNASFCALNLVKIQEQLYRQRTETIRPFSMASYKVRFHNETMIERFFSRLNLNLTQIKLMPIYQEIVNYGAITFGRV